MQTQAAESSAPAAPILPEVGFIRLNRVLQVIPVSKSTWWQGVREGRYPKPVKLSANTTAWRAEDIRALVERLGGEQ